MMNEIMNTFLLKGDEFMPGMNYKLTSACACGPFTKNKERIQNFMQR